MELVGGEIDEVVEGGESGDDEGGGTGDQIFRTTVSTLALPKFRGNRSGSGQSETLRTPAWTSTWSSKNPSCVWVNFPFAD